MTAEKLLEAYGRGERYFREVNLERVNLQQANLAGANLQGSNFYRTNLEGANLAGADLRSAFLRGANLQGANLKGANLQQANLQFALLKDADLREAEVLAAVVSVSTFKYSGWTLDELKELSDRGASMVGFADLLDPTAKPGLTLYFNTRLSLLDRLLIDSIVVAFHRGVPWTDCRVAYAEEGEARTFVRLEGSDPDHLAQIAEILHGRSWEGDPTAAPPDALAAQVTGLIHPAQLPALSFLVSRSDRFELWIDRDGTPEKQREWKARGPRKALADLLALLFRHPDALRTFLALVDNALGADMPDAGGDTRRFAHEIAGALERRERIDERFFLLLLEEPSAVIPDIAYVARRFDVALPLSVVEDLPEG